MAVADCFVDKCPFFRPEINGHVKLQFVVLSTPYNLAWESVQIDSLEIHDQSSNEVYAWNFLAAASIEDHVVSHTSICGVLWAYFILGGIKVGGRYHPTLSMANPTKGVFNSRIRIDV